MMSWLIDRLWRKAGEEGLLDRESAEIVSSMDLGESRGAVRYASLMRRLAVRVTARSDREREGNHLADAVRDALSGNEGPEQKRKPQKREGKGTAR